MMANVKGCAIPTIVMCALLILGCFLREQVHLKQSDDSKSPKSKSHGIEFFKEHKSTIFMFLSVLCTAAVMGILIRYLTVYKKNKTLPNAQNYTTMKKLRMSLKWLSGLNIVFILFFTMSTMTMKIQHKKTFIHFFIHNLSSILTIFAVVIFILCLCIPKPSMGPSPLPPSPQQQVITSQSPQPLFFFPPSISPISLPPISPNPYQPILTATPTYF